MRRVNQPPQAPQAAVAPSKELPPAHQASLPQSQVARATPVYQPPSYSSVAPQVKSSIYLNLFYHLFK